MTRAYRKRDPQGNPERLLKAVGQILRKQGHVALSSNEIAKLSKVGKRYIVELFGGRFELIRAYLFKHDFWLPRFAKQRAKALPAGEDIPKLFIQLLQEQFRYFLKNEELRRLILWQISEAHPLMAEINAKRESEGERLMALAARHFDGTGIDIHAVIGLAVGGGYFYGLQAATGNGPVCGLDMNDAHAIETATRTFGQMLQLFWWAAEAVRNGNLPPDHFDTTYFTHAPDQDRHDR